MSEESCLLIKCSNILSILNLNLTINKICILQHVWQNQPMLQMPIFFKNNTHFRNKHFHHSNILYHHYIEGNMIYIYNIHTILRLKHMSFEYFYCILQNTCVHTLREKWRHPYTQLKYPPSLRCDLFHAFQHT